MDQSGVRRCKIKVAPRLVVACLALMLSACDPFSISLLGASASAGISSQLQGINYRTFADSLLRVKKATLAAMEKMKIKVDGVNKTEAGETIRARANDRTIEVQLESLTATATRVRAVARTGSFFLVDSATSLEILQQTEKAL